MSSFSSRLTTFLTSTDTHGVKFLSPSDTTNSTLRRAVWTVALLGAFTFLGYFFYLRITDYLDFKTTTKVTYNNQKDSIPLPSVTVCPNGNGILASKLTASDIINLQSAVSDLNIGLNRETVTFEKQGNTFLSADAQEFFKRVLQNTSYIVADDVKQFLTVEEQHVLPFQVMHCRRSCLNWRPLFRTLAEHDLSKSLQSLHEYNYWNLLDRAAANLTTFSILTFACFRSNFNEDFPTVSTDCPSFKTHVKRFSQCFILQLNPRVSRALIKVPVEPYFSDGFFINRSIGDVVSDIGASHEKITTLKIGKTTDIRVSTVTRNHHEDKPYGLHCQKAGDIGTSIGVYKRRECVDVHRGLCIERVTASKYACRVRGSTKEYNHLPACARHELDIGPTCDKKHFLAQCPQFGCDETVFSGTVEDKLGVPGNFITISVLKNPDIAMTMYEEIALYPVESLLAELGGTMGLFVGISLLTILHCLEFVLTESKLALGRMFTNTSEEEVDADLEQRSAGNRDNPENQKRTRRLDGLKTSNEFDC